MRVGLNSDNVNPDTQYEIVEEPRYVTFNKGDTTVKKLVVPLKDINTDTEYNYYPNKSSLKKLVSTLGQNTENWVNHYLAFEVVPVMFKGKQVKSISIKDIQ